MTEDLRQTREDYLGPAGEDEWRRLREQLRLADGFWLGFLFVWSVGASRSLFQRCKDIERLRGRSVHEFRPESPAQLISVLEELLDPATAQAGLVWVEALENDARDLDDSSGPWTDAWDRFFLRANEKRDSLRRHLRGGLIFAAPPPIKERVRRAAPDLWSVRGIVLEVPQVRATASPADLHDGGHNLSRSSGKPDADVDPEFALDEANRRLQRAGTDSRSATRSLLRAVDGFLASGQVAEATDAAIRAVALLTNGPPEYEADLAAAFAALARAEVASQDWTAAAQHIRRAIELGRATPSDDLVDWLLLSGKINRRLARLDVARQDLTEALGLAQRFAAASQNSSRILKLSIVSDALGDIATLQGDLTLALQQYENALSIDQRLAAEDPGNAELQGNLAIGLSKIGNVRRTQGDLAGALRAYQDGRAIRERLAASHASHSKWQRDLSVSWNQIGDVRRAQGDLAGALRAYEDGRAISEGLTSVDPGNTESRRDLSVSWDRIGDMLRAQGDLAGALRAYEDGHTITEQLVASDPANIQWQRDLSVSWDRIGDIRRDQGDLAGAVRAYDHGSTIAGWLAATDPNNTQWQRDLSVTWDRIGDIRQTQGDLAGALAAYEYGHAIRERLVTIDPTNTEWQRDLSISWNKIGDVRLAQRDAAGALSAYENVRALAERLADEDSSNAEWQRDLSVSWNKIGDARLAQGDLADALRAYEDGRAIAERLATSDPSNAEWQRDRSVGWEKIGAARSAQGKTTEAVQSYETALTISKQLSALEPSNATVQADMKRLAAAIDALHVSAADVAKQSQESTE